MRATGERHGRAKLTTRQVRAIRRAHARGNTSQRALGRRFGVSHTTIWAVARRILWRSVR